jgi:hypothetical protein
MRVLGGHQPHIFPGVEYFARMSVCDVWIYADNVKFNRHDWQNRNRIKGPRGWQYLIVPVAGAEADEGILEKRISYGRNWPEKMWATLEQVYKPMPYFQDLAWIQEILSSRPVLLVDLIRAVMARLVPYLGIQAQLHWASELPPLGGSVSERLAERAAQFQANVYATGPQGWAYLDLDPFATRHIQIRSYIWTPPVYPQRWNEDGFVPALSVLDLIAACGPQSGDILRKSIRISEGQGAALASGPVPRL